MTAAPASRHDAPVRLAGATRAEFAPATVDFGVPAANAARAYPVCGARSTIAARGNLARNLTTARERMMLEESLIVGQD